MKPSHMSVVGNLQATASIVANPFTIILLLASVNGVSSSYLLSEVFNPLLLPKFEHIFVAVITFFPLSSVQTFLLPACCLLCVLKICEMSL